MAQTEKATQFLAKLKALLVEYDATIEADYGEGTDTHGINGVYMVINVGRWDRRDQVTLKVCDGWEISARDIEINRSV